MNFEVVEYKRSGERKIWLKTDLRSEANDERRWLLDRKEQHDASMGTIAIERV